MTTPNLLVETPTSLVYDTHDLTPAEAIGAARAHLMRDAVGEWEAYEREQTLTGLKAVRAWWGGDDVGFVQSHHAKARPVTVVGRPVYIAPIGELP